MSVSSPIQPNTELESARLRLSGDLTPVLNLRPLPVMALKINQACQQPDADLNLLIEMIQCEPSLVSRILSLVNSSVYGYTREISSINQAVVVLGFRKLSELVTATAAKQIFEIDPASQAIGIKIFEHSLACASAARVMFQHQFAGSDAGPAFLAGLLHDVGKLFLFDLAPVAYGQLHYEGSPPLNVSSIRCEREWFGRCHAELGSHFALASGLPSVIRTAIEQHHSKDSNLETQTELAANTELANAVVKVWRIGGSCSNSAAEEIVAAWSSTQPPHEVDQLREKTNEQFTTLRSLFLDQ